MEPKRGSFLEKVLPFVVAAFYAGIMAYMVIVSVTRAQKELRRVRARKPPSLLQVGKLLRSRVER